MLELWFEKVFSFMSRHKKLVLALLCMVMAICAVAGTRIRFDNDISAMLPADPALRRDLSLIRESVFAGKVVLSFELTSSSASLDDLVHYVDTVAARLPVIPPRSRVHGNTTKISCKLLKTNEL